MELEIVPLGDIHDVVPFDCGEDEIDRHLKWDARRHIKSHSGMTHVAVDPSDSSRVYGFYSCRVSEFNLNQKPPGLKEFKGESMPILIVTHFGVQKAIQRRKIGEQMLIDLYRRAQVISQNAGCHAVCLYALNDEVVSFYEKYDMKPYGMDRRKLWIPISTIEQFDLL